MKTPTIQDVNDLGCCCPFPECPGNRWKHQDREANPSAWMYQPFIEPEGAPDDDIPLLYPDSDNQRFYGENGTACWYEGWFNNPTDATNSQERRQTVTVSFDPESIQVLNGWAGLSEIVIDGNSKIIDPPIYDFFPTGPDTLTTTDPFSIYAARLTHLFSTDSDWAYEFENADYINTIEEEHYEVTADRWKHHWDTIQYQTAEPAHALQGATGDPGITSYSFDITVFEMEDVRLQFPKSKEAVIDDAILALEYLGYGGIETTVPESSTLVVHGRVSDDRVERWPWIQDGEDWPAAPNYGITDETERPDEFKITTEVLGLKYRVGIPEAWEIANAAWSAWKTLHDAWELEDPETRGDEPVEPDGKRSVFECQWQDVFFPQAWEEWREENDAWLEDPEGLEPLKPTAEEDRPSLVEDREWTYGGPGEPAFSDEFLMPPPSAPGNVRPVNMMIICYHASTVGVKPTAHGEHINLEDP